MEPPITPIIESYSGIDQFLESKIQYLTDALKLSGKFTFLDLNNSSLITREGIQVFMIEEWESFNEKNIRQLKCRENESLMICGSLFQKLYLFLSQNTSHQQYQDRSAQDRTLNKHCSLQDENQCKKLKKSDCFEIQVYLLLYLAILLKNSSRSCSETYLKLWSKKAASRCPGSVNQFCFYIGNMSFILNQLKDNLEYLQKYVETVKYLLQKMKESTLKLEDDENMSNILENVKNLQKILRDKDYKTLKLSEESQQKLIKSTRVLIMVQYLQENELLFYSCLIIAMATQRPYLLYKVHDKIFSHNTKCGSFHQNDFFIQDLILKSNIRGKIVECHTFNLKDFRPMIQIEITAITQEPPFTFKESLKKQNSVKQQKQCLFTILDPITKTCGFLQQKFFFLYDPSQSNLSANLLQALQELAYIQRASDLASLIDSLKQIRKSYSQADFYIFDVCNVIQVGSFIQFSQNNQFEALIYIYRTQNILDQSLKIITTTVLTDWSLLPQELKQIKKSQTRKKMFLTFTVATGRQKSKINKFQFNMKWMNQCCVTREDRRKAKEDFYLFIDQWLNWSSIIGSEVKEVYQLINKYDEVYEDLPESARILLNLYTRQNFFYAMINKSLRGFTNPQHVGYLRYIFTGFFRAIQYISSQTKSLPLDLICYRGIKLSKKHTQQLLEQFQNLKQDYIEMQGFISTSKNREIAETFGNLILQIQVHPHSMQNSLKSGFAIIPYSHFVNQQQVLFNSRNYYLVKEVNRQNAVIKLEYCHLEVPQKYKTDDKYVKKFKEIMEYHDFINKIKIKTQGDVFLQSGDYGNAVAFYEKQLIQHSFYTSKHKISFKEEDLDYSISQLQNQLNLQKILWLYIEAEWKENFKSHSEYLKQKTKNQCQNSQKLFYFLILHLIKLQLQNCSGLFSTLGLNLNSMKLAKRAEHFSKIARYILQVHYNKLRQSNSAFEKINQLKFRIGQLNILIAGVQFYKASYDEMLNNLQCEQSRFYQESIKETLNEIIILRCLGACYMAYKNHPNTFQIVQEYFLRCIEILDRHQLKVSIQYIQNKYNLVNLYINYGYYQKVLQPLESAIRICVNSFGLNHVHNLLNLKCMTLYAFTVGDFWKFHPNYEKIKMKNEEVLKSDAHFTQNNCSLFLCQTTVLIHTSKFRQAQYILQKILPPIRELLSNKKFSYILQKVFLLHLYYCKFMLNKTQQFEKLKTELNSIQISDFQLNLQISIINLLIGWASNNFQKLKESSETTIKNMKAFRHQRNLFIGLAYAFLGLSLINLNKENKEKMTQCFKKCQQSFSRQILESSPFKYKAYLVIADGYFVSGQREKASSYLKIAQKILNQSGYEDTYEHYRAQKLSLKIRQISQPSQKLKQLQQRLFGNESTAEALQLNFTKEIDVTQTFFKIHKQLQLNQG